MLNTGMTQSDVSDLLPSEYKNGIITRVRSKMQSRGGRVVSIRLWDATISALEPFLCTGDRLLLNGSRPLVRDEMKGSKRSTYDSLVKAFRKLHCSITLRQLRQFSGDTIKRQFGKEVADHFLGHSVGKVDASYFSVHQERLDVAVAWLGELIIG
jgi:hypothetical protein